VVVVVTMFFVLFCQLPNLLNYTAFSTAASENQRRAAWSAEKMKAELAELSRAIQAKEIDPAGAARRQQEIVKTFQLETQRPEREFLGRLERAVRIANTVLPVGWLPLGVVTAAEGRYLPSLLGLAGMTLIGVVSLRQAYRTTVGQYQGQASNRKDRPAQAVVAVAAPADPARSRAGLMEARLPWLSEPVSAVALAGLQSLLRAPEAKMMLLSPVITALIFGSMLWNGCHATPEVVRPLIAIGAMGFVLMGMLQLMGNQFGFDRAGFRVFVLSAASRRDILAGKNLAFAPLALGIGLLELVGIQLICPMGVDHALSMLPLFLSMFLLFCLFANLVSILTPVYLAAGSMRAGGQKLTTGLLQFAMFLVVFPLTQAPVLLPLSVKAGLSLLGRAEGVPVCFLLSLIECALIIVLYRLVLSWQGSWLQVREQAILDAVTNRAA
jgi:hypothetical protein